MNDIESILAAHIEPGMRVAIADGPSSPITAVGGALSRVAAKRRGIELLLGWCLHVPDDFAPAAFDRARTIMAGFALRNLVADESVEYVPCRLGSVPSLVAGALKPDLVIASVRPGPAGWELCSDVGWTMAAARAPARGCSVSSTTVCLASRERPFEWNSVTVLGEIELPPVDLPSPKTDEVSERIGHQVASMISAGSVVQFGPGAVASASLGALEVPVSIDSGMINDDIVDLDRRGLLIGEPFATHLAGTSLLYRWADGRRIVHGLEHSHDITRLAARDIIAINTALEVDHVGQVNVETVGGLAVGGVGGHPDFAAAASRAPNGISIIAVPSTRRGASTLVDRLSAPTSTVRTDVDVVVTEHGTADLRGLGDVRRHIELRRIFP